MFTDAREIQRARQAAEEVLTMLGEVERYLKSARNWGFYDLLGAGLFSSIIKHRKIQRAESVLGQVNSKLHSLQKELRDLATGTAPQLNISSFERFADIAFDNIISDWMVQSKVQKSLKEVAQLKMDIEGVLETLDRIENG